MFNYWSIFTSVYWCWTVLPLFFAILDKFRARLLFVLNISSNIFRCLEGNVCSEGHIFPVSTPFVQKVTAACTFLGTAVGTKIFLQLKLSPSLTLPPLLCFQLPMTFMFNLPDSVLLLFCQPSLQSEDFARLDRKLLSFWQERFIFAFSKGNVLGSEYLSLWAMAWTNPIYSGNP